MAIKKDSVLGTMLFIICLSLVCSFMITGTAEVLKERKLVKQRDEVQRFVLRSAGIEVTDDFRETFAQRIKPKLLELDTGKLSDRDAILDFDERMAAINPDTSMQPEKDLAKIGRRANQVRIYQVFDENNQLSTLVLPVYGKGLWSIIYGYVAVEMDLNTIKNITFYEHGETPGIADFVTDSSWLSLWQGKQLFDDKGKLAIKVVKGGADAGDIHGVDGVSGATRTGVGIQRAVHFWFGEEGYQTFFSQLATTGGQS
ncbi:Na(+)-translocating NADH-quinone reductase subunit C [Shewanella maritima]|uniref:Na(+)-translocating NADH-quinone reductase subunit C n=1 Tax=Shewanella maritima TaxID=2520507 RepID=UPI003735B2F0